MLNISIKPTGNLIKGNVLDASVGPLVERLRDYDPLLFVRWDPRKLRGWGCWSVMRQPEMKTVKRSQNPIMLQTGKIVPPVQGDIYEFEGFTILDPKFHEMSLINHVLDVPYLNYQILDKLKEMDMWNQEGGGYKGKNITKMADYNNAKHLDKVEDKALKDLEYNLKQFGSEIKWFKDYVASGGNPDRIADYWDTSQKS